MSPHIHAGEVAIAIVGSCLLFGWPFVWIVAAYWHKTVRLRYESELKQELVLRGYTARDIVAIVAATRGKAPPVEPDLPPAKPPKQFF